MAGAPVVVVVDDEVARKKLPKPKSPPPSPDPCGRHRLQLAVDALHREIGFLEGEINSIEGAHPASKCCKEVDEFIGRNPDPFITIPAVKTSTESHHVLKKFRARICLSYLSWMCCCSGCSFQLLRRSSCFCRELKRLCCRCCHCCSSSSCCCQCSIKCSSICSIPRCKELRCEPLSIACRTCSCDCCTCSCPCSRCSVNCCIVRCCSCS